MNDLFLFAEGTTTNGQGLLPFKKGAFVCEGPIRLYALKYKGMVNPCFTLIDFFTLLIGLLCNLHTELTILKSDVCIYKKDGITWEEYAEEVRILMCNEFGF